MNLSAMQVAQVLLALGVVLAMAHGCGQLFVVLRQPRVIGEVLGGILLGPTALATLVPSLQQALLPSDGPVPALLGACYHLGLILLMFCSGTQIRTLFVRAERRTVAWVTLTGLVLPFAAGLLLFSWLDPTHLMGTAGDPRAVVLVAALATAVTSIPVISRIMQDLGIIGTAFARIVLGVAVVEDVAVYVVLAVTLNLVAAGGDGEAAVSRVTGLDPGSPAGLLVHVAITLVVFAFMLSVGTRAFRWSRHLRWNWLERSNPIAYHLLFLFAVTLTCLLLGITPALGAFLAGVAASTGTGPRSVQARHSIRNFSFAFFVPIYFAVVGMQLDLLRHFDLRFFLLFTMFACAVKSLSVYLGARLAAEPRSSAVNLAVAMNARGGPGIVLATVSYDAGVINQEFYASLVMLALVTSLIAGSWLGHIVRSGRSLRFDPGAPHGHDAPDGAVPSDRKARRAPLSRRCG